MAARRSYEGDVEVSEAIDFANYYADSFSDPAFYDGTTFEPYGTIVVTPPWNFPFAIPCGGVLAALMAGNTVILKPASATTLTGWVLANCLWNAGIPRDVLQFVACPGSVGRKLLTDDRTGGVILTGGWDTARMFLGWKPEMRLFAETSGKNALDHHRRRRSRPGGQGPGEERLRPLRPEMLRRLAGHRRSRGL